MDLAAYFRSVMELSHGIVVTLDLDGRLIHGNALLEQVTGRPLATLQGKDWVSLAVPEEARDLTRRHIRQCPGQRGVTGFRGAVRRRDGGTTHIEWRLKPLTDTGDALSGVMMVGHDITDHESRRRHLIRECAELKDRNRELTCLYGIARVAENTDRDLEDILRDIIALVPPALQHPEQSSVALETTAFRIETPGFSDDGVRLEAPVHIRGVRCGRLRVSSPPVAGETPPPAVIREEAELMAVVARQAGLIIAKKDAIASEKSLQVQLRHADRLAKIGQLAAGVAHELNEPLANILGFAQLATKTDGLDPQVKKDLDHIVRSSLHAREVIQKLMLFSRRMPPQMMRIDVNRIIDEALYFSASSAVRQGVSVNRDLAPRLPAVTADPQQLKQVIVNLATNAIQAMPDGGTLTIRSHAGDSHVFMIVEDTGSGMDAATLEQLFTPFFTTKDIDQGAGLGLSVVHGIVRAHGGSIDVHSSVGEGSTFTVSLPLTS